VKHPLAPLIPEILKPLVRLARNRSTTHTFSSVIRAVEHIVYYRKTSIGEPVKFRLELISGFLIETNIGGSSQYKIAVNVLSLYKIAYLFDVANFERRDFIGGFLSVSIYDTAGSTVGIWLQMATYNSVSRHCDNVFKVPL
jgi:hypothetical protein